VTALNSFVWVRALAATLPAALAAAINHHAKPPSSPLGEAVRLLRESRQISVRSLAAETGFSPSFISQIENGQASPSISSLERIAVALGVTLGEFFNAMRPVASPITRSSNRRQLTSGWSRASLESLGPGGPGFALDSMLITLLPGGLSAKHEVAGTREEFVHVLEGTVSMTLAGEELTLEAGDSVTISAGRVRKMCNATDRPARLIVVSTRNSR
jgi:transcriptional regulator with XRE-family HTH domain